MNKVDIHKQITEELNDTYKRKNNDYGDSFAQVRQRVDNAILVRLWDKLLRLETLMKGTEQQVNDESIEDTLADLANYAIMELVERRAANKILCKWYHDEQGTCCNGDCDMCADFPTEEVCMKCVYREVD